MKPKYINKKNKEVELVISNHAKQRFKERWNKLYSDRQLFDNIELESKITELFNNSNRLRNLKKIMKQRCKNHGNDTLYFINEPFRFVVAGNTIITIEIFPSVIQHLNINNNNACITKIKTLNHHFSNDDLAECMINYYNKYENTDELFSIGLFFIPPNYIIDEKLHPELYYLIEPTIQSYLVKNIDKLCTHILLYYRDKKYIYDYEKLKYNLVASDV